VQRFAAKGTEKRILMDALYRIFRYGKELASAGAVMDAIAAAAVAFYVKYGFLGPRVPRRLFPPRGTITQLF
jgi:DNA/RNA-binding domain of Phe-tRNA-synthetase-like protein